MAAMQLTGIHHLTAITAEANANHAFYTHVLGMRLVKKTVNQDDVSAYHLFYADGLASPGSDLTFFDWPAARERRGTRAIVETGLRVADAASLAWWREHLAGNGVASGEIQRRDGRDTLVFEDGERQRLCFVVDGGIRDAHPWDRSPIPAPHQIRGLGPITISVPDLQPTDAVLRDLLGMESSRVYPSRTEATTQAGTTHVYSMGPGGPAAELHVRVEPDAPAARQGAGSVHHVAFRIPDADYEAWTDRLQAARVAFSGPVDRFYFRSLYFREPSGILFEIATDGPGFTADEPLESLGERLALPPLLEPRRVEIEAGLKPISSR